MKTLFVTGIHTDAGKTVSSAILCQALHMDYWKPIQSGIITDSDTLAVKELLGETNIHFHPEAYRLKEPLSPHAAAKIDGVEIDLNKIIRPKAERLLIEGAGGLLVPLNEKDMVADLIQEGDKVVLVSRHYLGSINHTLLSIAYLNQKGIEPGILFNGNENRDTEEAIERFGKSKILGRIDETKEVNTDFVKQQSEKLKNVLEEWLMD